MAKKSTASAVHPGGGQRKEGTGVGEFHDFPCFPSSILPQLTSLTPFRARISLLWSVVADLACTLAHICQKSRRIG